jgi:hypothetical protein
LGLAPADGVLDFELHDSIDQVGHIFIKPRFRNWAKRIALDVFERGLTMLDALRQSADRESNNRPSFARWSSVFAITGIWLTLWTIGASSLYNYVGAFAIK